MKTITAYIIAGGKSSRMGTDKGLLLLNGKPIVSHIYEALVPIVGKNIVVVSSNTNYDFLGCNRIEDVVCDKGPVGGIYSALHHTKTNLNIIVSVDVPLVSTELFQWIVANHSADFLMTQIEAEGKSSPLIAVYDKSLEKVFKENLKNGQLRLRKVIESIKHQTLEVPEKWIFQTQNINTKAEYQRIVQ
jgi:molybdopterin-guanine dinucleotide biosynthesis protein A